MRSSLIGFNVSFRPYEKNNAQVAPMRCALLAQLLGVSAWLVSHEPEPQISGARALAESDSTTSRAAAPWSVPRPVHSPGTGLCGIKSV